MSSFLLNVWRENGAYLRFADTKNSAIAVISLGIFMAYFKYTFAVSILDWSTVQSDIWAVQSWKVYAALSMLLLSSGIAALSVVPTLSKRSVRTRLFLTVGRLIGLLSRSSNETTCVYFIDIAKYSTKNEFTNRIEKHLEIEMNPQNDEIAGQLWIISRIAAVKYIQHFVSLWLLIIGILTSAI